MSVAKSEAILQRFVADGYVRHLQTVTSSVTTNWGVDWSETLIARDLLQNFFDANRTRVGDIRVTRHERDVCITAPTPYPLERLFYLGSEKGPDDVGQYGEGFKVAATCLLRDHGVTPMALSDHQALCLRIAEEPVAGTALYPLVYDFFQIDPPCQGTRLILSGCSQKLAKALQAGLTHFFYPANPLLGERLWSSADAQFLIYASTTADGCVFYRNLRRGEIARLPLVLVIHGEHKGIEDRIKHDRDRNAFGEKLMDTFYKTFARKGITRDRTAMRIVVEAARASWESGHPLLHALAETSDRYLNTFFDAATADALFGDRYFARSHTEQMAQQLRYQQQERVWEQAGRRGLAAYFVKFGVESAERYLAALDARARQEAQRTQARPPTALEAEAIRLLTSILGQLSPAITAVFSTRQSRYTVACTEVILGELKQARRYDALDVFLAEAVFVADFAHALAIFLHEHAHIFGYDGSRGFTDALTGLIEATVRFRSEMDTYEARWQELREKVWAERGASEVPEVSIQARLAAMSEAELRSLVKRIPEALVERLLI